MLLPRLLLILFCIGTHYIASFRPIHSIPTSLVFSAKLESSTPEYLLIQPSTSLCQTSEFSGLSTHYNPNCQLRVLGVDMEEKTYVVFVREHQEPAGHAAALEGVECCQTFGDGESVVKLVVNDL